MTELSHGLATAFGMIWQMSWPLALGLIFSAWVRDWVPAERVSHYFGHNRLSALLLATGLGMLSSSCSFVAASLAKTFLAKGANMANTMVFMAASTNLILEMFMVLVALLGWGFLAGQIVAALLLLVCLALLFWRFPQAYMQTIQQRFINEQQTQAHNHSNKAAQDMQCGAKMKMDSADPMQCGAKMAMSSESSKSSHLQRSARYFAMDIDMIGRDLFIGLLVGAAVIAWVPANTWAHLLHSLLGAPSQGTAMPLWLSFLEVLLGVGLAVVAYVCSIGNVMIAAALWHGGFSFGAVLAFILSDLITIPMVRVYSHYFGRAVTQAIVWRLVLGIVCSGVCVNLWLGASFPTHSTSSAFTFTQFGWNATTVLNVVTIPLACAFYRLGKR
ncbi:MAG: permease [Ferrimonas sp.]